MSEEEKDMTVTERTRYFKDRYQRTRNAFIWFIIFSLATFGYFWTQVTQSLFSLATLGSGLLFLIVLGSTIFLIYRSQKYRTKWKKMSGGEVE